MRYKLLGIVFIAILFFGAIAIPSADAKKVKITDTDFAKGIEYLIENEIIEVPPAVSHYREQTVETIPDWVKSTAGWWGNGLLTDQDFVNGIKWLVEQGIITVK